MIIVLPMDKEDETEKVSKYFARCNYFLFYNSEKKEYSYVKNTAKDSVSGAGSKAAQIIIDQGASCIICYQMGTNALRVISLAKIDVFKALDLSASKLIEKFLDNELVLIK